jgi:hypothetical protein
VLTWDRMTHRHFLALAVALVALPFAGCGSGTAEANPCATPGATYLEHFAEHPGGTCGPITDQVLNINHDGTIDTASPDCDSVTQDGCTARDTNCRTSANGTDCTATTSVTFAKDGSAASGIATISCTAGSSSCESTYDISAERR